MSARHILRIVDFRLLLLSRFFFYVSLQIQAVIVGWQIYQIKPDALLLGMIGLAEALPAIACSFFSGHVVDQNRPWKIYYSSLLALFLNSLILFLSVYFSASISDYWRLFYLFSAVFVSGVVRSFASPSVFSLIPQVVEKHHLPAASAWSGTTHQIEMILGPAVGGLIYGFFGAAVAFSLLPILVLCSLLLLPLISEQTRLYKMNRAREPFVQSLKAGIDFVKNQKVLLSAMSLDMFSVLFGGAVSVLPIFADQVFHVGSTGLGFLRAAPAIGSVIVALSLAIRPMRLISGKKLLLVVAGFGFSTLAFAFLESYFFIGYLVSIALFGLFQAIFMANAGGAWDNTKKLVEVDLKEKGTALHAATVVGDTVGDPFKDTSSVSINPVIKFTTLFGLLAIEIAIELNRTMSLTLASIFLVIAVIFIYKSFEDMRTRGR